MNNTFTDRRSEVIAREFGMTLAIHADKNLAGWVLDMLSDTRVQTRTPRNSNEVFAAMFEGVRVCDGFLNANQNKHLKAMVGL